MFLQLATVVVGLSAPYALTAVVKTLSGVETTAGEIRFRLIYAL